MATLEERVRARRVQWIDALWGCESTIDSYLYPPEAINRMAESSALASDWIESGRKALGMTAVVLFCQVLVPGHGTDEVAGNDEMRDVLEAAVTATYPDATSRTGYEQLKQIVRNARDKLIGHADGAALGVTHLPDRGVKLNRATYALRSIDFAALAKTAAALRQEISLGGAISPR